MVFFFGGRGSSFWYTFRASRPLANRPGPRISFPRNRAGGRVHGTSFVVAFAAVEFFFFPVAGVKRHGGLRVAPELERIAVAAHACCLAPIAPTNLAILPRAGNSPG